MLKEFKNKLLERKLNNINILIEENRKLQEIEKDDIKLYKLKKKACEYSRKQKKIKDDIWWLNLPKEERNNQDTNLSFYKLDSNNYWLVLLVTAIELYYLIVLLSMMERSFYVGIVILFNIGVLLFLFTCAIKIRAYKKVFSYLIVGYGAYCLLRFAVLPFMMNVDLYNGSSKMWQIIVCLIISSVISIRSGYSSILKCNRQIKYINDGKIILKTLSR
jgi:hypothetical protein